MKTHPHRVRGLRLLALTFAAALVSILGAAAPAYAAVGDCPSGYICMWEHSSFQGARLQYNPSSTQCWNLPSSWNDRVSSWRNNKSSMQFYLYEHANCQGWWEGPYNGYPIPPYQASTPSWYYFNDRASSVFWCFGSC